MPPIAWMGRSFEEDKDGGYSELGYDKTSVETVIHPGTSRVTVSCNRAIQRAQWRTEARASWSARDRRSTVSAVGATTPT